MDQPDLQQVINHLGAHWGKKPCPACEAEEQWSVDEDLAALLRVAGPTNEVQLNPAYLVVTVRCDECGYTMMFSAKNIGLR